MVSQPAATAASANSARPAGDETESHNNGRPRVIGGGPADKYRLTVLTDGVVRYEWAPDGVFEDRPSMFALHRDQASGPSDCTVRELPGGSVQVTTAYFELEYNRDVFTPHGLFARVFQPKRHVWRYGISEPRDNLGGTIRTLDDVDGEPEDKGLGVLSRKGYAAVDDSDSMLLDPSTGGFVAGRRPGPGRVDGYLFAYGLEYREAMRAFYQISGPQPMLPRWALGNWWSRYYPYSAESYLALVDEFAAREVPLSVAVLDMDWHLVKDPRVIEAGQSGWTGYTWNRELFPDPAAFVAELHSRGLKVTLNDHPADGVHYFEDMYARAAEAMGIDPATKQPVGFDPVDRRFLHAYYDIVLKAREADGVDFWWIDWQQGSFSRLGGADPLWILNHFGYDHIRRSKPRSRPLILSRYAGPGSHRNPVGFSGDAILSWASLAAQPAFTARASNVGYGWWSHDIGGHLFGGRDDELTARWVQLGVFSPLLRLHSANTPWIIKEPWRLRHLARESATAALRLRHRLVPYLHSMNVRASRQAAPLVEPLYWQWAWRDEAYRFENQFLFGTGLMVVPVTSPADPKLGLALTKGWLPPGRWVDFFTGQTYSGDRELSFSRDLLSYGVFMREGAIVALDGSPAPHGHGTARPDAVELVVAVGADGGFVLYEDADDDVNAVVAVATIDFDQAAGKLTCRGAPSDVTTSSRHPRSWTVVFPGFFPPPDAGRLSVTALEDGSELAFEATTTSRSGPAGLRVALTRAAAGDFVVSLGTAKPRLDSAPRLDPLDRIRTILDDAQIAFATKQAVWVALGGGGGVHGDGGATAGSGPVAKRLGQLRRLESVELSPGLRAAVLELLLADEVA